MKSASLANLFYALAMIVLIVGLLYLAGYIGKNRPPQHASDVYMTRLIYGTDQQHKGGCTNCRWY